MTQNELTVKLANKQAELIKKVAESKVLRNEIASIKAQMPLSKNPAVKKLTTKKPVKAKANAKPTKRLRD